MTLTEVSWEGILGRYPGKTAEALVSTSAVVASAKGTSKMALVAVNHIRPNGIASATPRDSFRIST
ncbi:putative FlgJ-related protein [Nitrobacter winogradskyi]|uniref:FlgJ-related protein n=1 Tax=Nitrobacter winogradskyi TaxID=913 RepID=A0ACC6AJA4_NITWI|nr:putative FlgJ-related protein [Nitrobacter winogradskyi]